MPGFVPLDTLHLNSEWLTCNMCMLMLSGRVWVCVPAMELSMQA